MAVRKLNDMQLINMNIIENSIKTAKYKLSLHKQQGANSNLSIFQVAQLMDRVKEGESLESRADSSIGFSLN